MSRVKAFTQKNVMVLFYMSNDKHRLFQFYCFLLLFLLILETNIFLWFQCSEDGPTVLAGQLDALIVYATMTTKAGTYILFHAGIFLFNMNQFFKICWVLKTDFSDTFFWRVVTGAKV